MAEATATATATRGDRALISKMGHDEVAGRSRMIEGRCPTMSERPDEPAGAVIALARMQKSSSSLFI